jgi:hypothetical protein
MRYKHLETWQHHIREDETMTKGILTAVIIVAFASTAIAADTLCSPRERVVFSCGTAKKRIVSVCASRNLSASTGYLQYRFGKKGAVELTVPRGFEHPKKHVERNNSNFINGGYISGLTFKNDAFSYAVYESELRDGPNRWVSRQGVTVERDGKTISELACKGAFASEMGESFLDNAGIPLAAQE